MFNFLKKASSIAKKVFLIIAVYVIVISLFANFFSAGNPQKKVDVVRVNRELIYRNINDPKLKNSKDGKQVIALYKGAMCGLIGEACTNNPADGDKNFDKSFFGTLTKAIILPYSAPPASGVYWVYSGLQNTGFVPKAQAAQGIGFAAIQPISGLWKIFRDAALIILVLFLVAIGFLIMFRIKVNPQTVITLENSLPRIVITLIIIVFSFAISGFLIDLMYIVSAMALLLLNRPDTLTHFINGGSAIVFGEIFANHGIWEIGNAIFSLLPSTLSSLLRGLVISGVLLALSALPGFKKVYNLTEGIPFIAGLLGLILSVMLLKLSVPIIGNMAGWILSLVILVTSGMLLFFRIFFMLLMAYIRILLNIIFAPVILMFEAIPGKNMLFNWVRSLVGDLIVFPTTAVLLAVSSTIVNSATNTASVPIWQAPLLSSQGQSGYLSILVGMGILFLIPNLVKKLKEILGIKPSGINLGAGIFFGGIGGVGKSIMGPLGQFSTLRYGLGAFEGVFKDGKFNPGAFFKFPAGPHRPPPGAGS